jgi:hypothetical protein
MMETAMRTSAVLPSLLSLMPFVLACSSNIPAATEGERIAGRVRYDGDAHRSLSRPALQIMASIDFPPTRTPHGLLVIENPSFPGTVAYELTFLPSQSYKVAAQIIDLDNPDAGSGTLPLGGYPNLCALLQAGDIDIAMVTVTEDLPAMDVDLQLYDEGGLADPCFQGP